MPRSAVRVVRKARVAECTRCGSVHQKPISAYDIAPITSQAPSSTTRSVAVTVSSIAEEKMSINPKKRARASCRANSPAA